MPPILFSPYRLTYRSPFGAVAEGSAVFFRICVPREWECHTAYLSVKLPDGTYNDSGMFWAGMEGDAHEWWDCTFTPQTAGSYRYTFRIETNRGTRWFTPLATGNATDSPQENGRYLLICFPNSFETPAEFAGGIMYQIFPDRFFRSGTEKRNVPHDRRLRDDWGGQPEWQPNHDGKVLNNDFFGGDLEGIRQKLPYLASLGVTILYLNPIFESHSNHRYDTADYERIDPLLGDEKSFQQLCREAALHGIKIVLDGVFSHTGSDSRYFNKEHRYQDTEGAFESMDSPYFTWYQFKRWPQEYSAWWGFPTLPETQECDPSFSKFILGENGVLAKWMRAGCAGWRLDVADELPDRFLDGVRSAVKRVDPHAIIIGEVWEDAADKFSYGHLRRYLLGKQLDSVMNYPFREAILGYAKGGNGSVFFNKVLSILDHYPPQVIRLLMNSLSTHDTERALTVLGGEPSRQRDRRWQAGKVMSDSEYADGVGRLKIASSIQYCLPGIPCLYYGDEAGMQGYADPFNRGCFPWGQENGALLNWFRALGKVRHDNADLLANGDFSPLAAPEETVLFTRAYGEKTLLCAANASLQEVTANIPSGRWKLLLGEAKCQDGRLTVPAVSTAILIQ